MHGTQVWIEAGCTRCHWCHQLLPAVFADGPASSVVRPEAVLPGGRCLRPGVVTPEEDCFLEFVADGCPARVIHLRRDPPVA